MSLGIYNFFDGIKYKTGKDDIRESLIRVLFTLPGERVGNPTFGCNLRGLLFEPEFIFLDEVKNVVEKAVAQESRVFLKSMDLEKVSINEYKIYLNFVNKINSENINLEQSILT